MVLNHGKTLALRARMGNIFSLFNPPLILALTPSSYWRTTLTNEGIMTPRRRGAPARVAWSDVKSVDVAGLRRPTPARSFMLLLKDDTSAGMIARGTGGKTYAPATNVLLIENILPEQAETLRAELKYLSDRHGFTLDSILIE